MKRHEAERQGRRAEVIASLWLQLKGWRILARRARTSRGEVDIIAARGRIVAFVEVKARATERGSELALDRHRLRRVAAAAESLWPAYARPGRDCRIDAIFITPWRLPRHEENVWHG